MATHCSLLAWRIPQIEKPGWLQSMGSQRGRRDSSSLARKNSVGHCSQGFLCLPLTSSFGLVLALVLQRFLCAAVTPLHFCAGIHPLLQPIVSTSRAMNGIIGQPGCFKDHLVDDDVTDVCSQ